MVFFREWVVDDILRSMALEGHRMPKRMTLVLKKIWFTMDISNNTRRLGMVHNRRIWTNKDLFLATMFFIKLDMRLTHPVTGNGEVRLRSLLLGQRSLSTLAKVLRREEMRNQLEMLRMIVRYSYERDRFRNQPIMGIPPHQIGRLQYEGWGLAPVKLFQIDELVMMEAARRGINMEVHYVNMMLLGFIDKKTWSDVRNAMPQPAKGEAQEEEESESDSEDDDEEMKLYYAGYERAALFEKDDDENKDEEGADKEENDEMDVDPIPKTPATPAAGEGSSRGHRSGNNSGY